MLNSLIEEHVRSGRPCAPDTAGTLPLERRVYMFQLQNVLFPVDFSSRCRGAARLLDSLHQFFRPEVTLIHVLPPPHLEYTMADLGGGVFQEYTQARTEQVKKDLEYFLDDELKHFHLKRVLLEGDPA